MSDKRARIREAESEERIEQDFLAGEVSGSSFCRQGEGQWHEKPV
jgi:hypothetical protein